MPEAIDGDIAITAVVASRHGHDRGFTGRRPHQFCHVDNCLGSLLSSKRVAEIIVVNNTFAADFPKDEQLEYIKSMFGGAVKIVETRGDVRLFNKSWMVNVGIRIASCDFFMLHDIDTILNPGFDEAVADVIDSLRSDSVLHYSLRTSPNDCDWTTFQYPGSFHEVFDRSADYDSPSHVVCRTDKAREIRGYDERFATWGWEDEDFLRALRVVGLRAVYCAGRHLHQSHTRSLLLYKTPDEIRAVRENSKIFEEHTPLSARNTAGWGDPENGPNTFFERKFENL